MPLEVSNMLGTKHQLSKIHCLLAIYEPMICLTIFILLSLAILNEVAIYHIGLITGDYYKILIEKNQFAFWKQTAKSVSLIIAISLLKSLKDYVASYLYVSWRQCLTSILHENYFKNFAFYHLNVNKPEENSQVVQLRNSNEIIPKKNDNVDQRITQDVDKMFQALSTLIPEILVSPFILVFYWYKCQKATGWIGPVGCLVLFVVGSFVNYFLVRRVSKWVYAQERCEGDFRFQHLRIRNNAESIAFISGEKMEKLKCQNFLIRLISTQKWLIFQQFWLKFSTNLSDYFGSILSFLALAVPLFAGRFNDLKPDELTKLISQNAFFTMYLINCFTRLIDLSSSFSIFLGTYHRISELSIWLDRNNQKQWRDKQQEAYQSKSSEIYQKNIVDPFFFDVKDVTIRTPGINSREVVTNLNLQIKEHVNLIITGPSGVGKSSIFRCLKQIWPIANGKFERNVQLDNPMSVMFLSYKPVLTTGSIAEQIIYPGVYVKENWQQDESFRIRVFEIMMFLDLETAVLKRVNYDIHHDFNENWIDHLSAGEVQRFNLARIFYYSPKIVFLDECTTALPEEQEASIFEELINRYNVTIVSCGHRKSLWKLHQMELRMHNNLPYELIDLGKKK